MQAMAGAPPPQINDLFSASNCAADSPLPFHPAVSQWFHRCFGNPTPAQSAAWPAIQAGTHTLVAAPTGSGKTLAAFLAAIDALVRSAQAGTLGDQTRVLYVSPLKALSTDIRVNLQDPLAGIEANLEAMGAPPAGIRVGLRTGDSSAAERTALLKRPPHILVTTPESLYLLLTSGRGRQLFAGVETLIVDEIHALVTSKRGTHLALSMERLQSLSAANITRIGLSATQKPMSAVARFLTGRDADGKAHRCHTVDLGHRRQLDIALELPPVPLEAVMSNETWEALYDRIAELVRAHRTTLVFVNTRRLAERVCRHLTERLGETAVGAHHGSLSKEQRQAAEARLRAGELKALVATASLELGIDIGEVDLVCQIGATRAISTLLQRVGRASHQVGGTPKGRLFPLSRNELVESTALLDAIARGELDNLVIPHRSLDVLAQQVVAEVAGSPIDAQTLYHRFRQAEPYHDLHQADFDRVVDMLCTGFTTRRGRRGSYLHRHPLSGELRPHRRALLTALTSGGTIPDTADYDVVVEPKGTVIGTLNEDFAIESLAGDIFQLGNNAWRILKVEAGKVRVEDAQGQPPNLPFWFGEAPARSDALSAAVSRLREEVGAAISAQGVQAAAEALQSRLCLPATAALQLCEYLAAAQAALGTLPTLKKIVFERFFDESGGMQFIVHAPFGGRINRAWGLALRKRFCRKFNFELQAAATENCIILSLGPTHSFPLLEVASYLHPNRVRDVLVQALLDAPLFQVRWRWTATNALAIPRFQGGRKNPPQLQRLQAEDLIALVFPDQLACLENIRGEREVPDHPLVEQTLTDCLTDAMDIDGLEGLLQRLSRGEVEVVTADLREPSPLAEEVLTARPYAFLDDAPLEERRTQAVTMRRWLDPEDALTLGRLDPAAIEQVRATAWPVARSADELYDAATLAGLLTNDEACSLDAGLGILDEALAGKILMVLEPHDPAHAGAVRYCALERWPEVQALQRWNLHGSPPQTASAWNGTAEDACQELVRSRLEVAGPTTADALATVLAISASRVQQALLALEAEGFALRGHFSQGEREEWCERQLLARIHKGTLKQLRQETAPVSAAQFLAFLSDWQGLTHGERAAGVEGLYGVIEQLAGLSLSLVVWETAVLPARLDRYDPAWLDQLTGSGRVVWVRTELGAARQVGAGAGPLQRTRMALLPRADLGLWLRLRGPRALPLSGGAARVAALLTEQGALFFDEIQHQLNLLPSHLEQYLAELVRAGRASSDSVAGWRTLATTTRSRQRSRHRRRSTSPLASAGRWSHLPVPDQVSAAPAWFGSRHSEADVTEVTWRLMDRYGVLCRALAQADAEVLPPWRDLVRVLRKLEARGELRGGYFVAGTSGEQFALPEALERLRRAPAEPANLSISIEDPLNLQGVLLPRPQSASPTSERINLADTLTAQPFMARAATGQPATRRPTQP